MTSEQTKSASKTAEKAVVSANKKPISPLWWVAGTLVVVCFILLGVGAVRHAVLRAHNAPMSRGYAAETMPKFQSNDNGPRFHHSTMMNDRDNDTSVSGVITAINGNTITVAGHGTTKQVTTNDTTEYYGAAQPAKVNDSVRIHGTASGETFTAKQIMISRSAAQ